MLSKTRAIVFRNTNYSESSVISKMYTREFGLRSYMFKGIKRGKSAIKPAMILPLSIVDMDVYNRPNSNINSVKDLKPTLLLIDTQLDMAKKSVALFMIELLNQCITEEQCEEKLFDFIEAEILDLEISLLSPLKPIVFMLKLADHLGVMPNGYHSKITPYLCLEQGRFVSDIGIHTSSIPVSNLLSELKSENAVTQVDSSIRREALNQVIKYYQYHITKNKKLNSVEILAELLS
jgi:DNA repair protein RecO (recombination protein O)